MDLTPPPAALRGEGKLALNILHFARLLRRAGLPVGPADMLAAQQAVTLVDLGQRAQVRTALHATLVHRHEHAVLFDQAFALFWRAPDMAPESTPAGLPGTDPDQPAVPAPPGARRLAEALGRTPRTRAADPSSEREATTGASAHERLHTMDFEAMGAAEIAAAKQEIRRLVLPLQLRPTRRRRADPAGPQLDLRRTIRASLRSGGEILDIAATSRVTRSPPLVVLCDISGSMNRYAQVLLHFLHAVANDRDRVHVFLFGTRLTNVTRQLRHRDPEAAFQMVAHAVPDWSGGTRIGEALSGFNRLWARRVLGQGAVVLLVTDGLDRDGAAGLADAMERLHKSCARLVWLNPLLRWARFEPRSQGIRAMLPHVDEFRTIHNLASLRALVESLSRPAAPREMDRWRKAS
ncbi:carbon monoxide dehydrogenase E protein [Rhodovastum atsumiense]|uniref:VWA domain-containing protein n=1 Tax=Rhodovastum atsumiense TaxID=504468 RepID=A0A5M6IKE7_9PROT|nr:VWA domain-containing protein [Rhodovastum atsumiense]KAA5608731.1 VWA domain-containing protein [Rhodovastum atsumiense]CAH2604955.1 carbon monoxide dehydrogenase E protein [Rhodovastum atsumiense]